MSLFARLDHVKKKKKKEKKHEMIHSHESLSEKKAPLSKHISKMKKVKDFSPFFYQENFSPLYQESALYWALLNNLKMNIPLFFHFRDRLILKESYLLF